MRQGAEIFGSLSLYQYEGLPPLDVKIGIDADKFRLFSRDDMFPSVFDARSIHDGLGFVVEIDVAEYLRVGDGSTASAIGGVVGLDEVMIGLDVVVAVGVDVEPKLADGVDHVVVDLPAR